MKRGSVTTEITIAIDHVNSALDDWKVGQYKCNFLNPSEIVTGYEGFSNLPIQLQKGQDWRWNKTSQKYAEVREGIQADVQKMISRSKEKGVPAPSYKVWVFRIYCTVFPQPLYYFWCEKGAPPSPLHISELSFLQPFVDEELAKEFGWGNT